MWKSTSLLAAVGLLAGAYMVPATASAASMSLPALQQTTDSGNIHLAATTVKKTTVIKKKKGRVVKKTTWVYSSARHGKRYRKRTGNYRYYYGGYYYSKPWWAVNVGVPGVNLCIGC